MIVCSCNVFSDRDVRECLVRKDGPKAVGDVYGRLGCAPKCGQCAGTIKRLIDQQLDEDKKELAQYAEEQLA